jgi:hypothetical protein
VKYINIFYKNYYLQLSSQGILMKNLSPIKTEIKALAQLVAEQVNQYRDVQAKIAAHIFMFEYELYKLSQVRQYIIGVELRIKQIITAQFFLEKVITTGNATTPIRTDFSSISEIKEMIDSISNFQHLNLTLDPEPVIMVKFGKDFLGKGLSYTETASLILMELREKLSSVHLFYVKDTIEQFSQYYIQMNKVIETRGQELNDIKKFLDNIREEKSNIRSAVFSKLELICSQEEQNALSLYKTFVQLITSDPEKYALLCLKVLHEMSERSESLDITFLVEKLPWIGELAAEIGVKVPLPKASAQVHSNPVNPAEHYEICSHDMGATIKALYEKAISECE